MQNVTAIIVLVFFLWSCKKEHHTQEPESARAKAVLRELVSTMQQHSIRKKEIDWTVFEERVLQVVDGYNSYPANVQKGIQQALDLLADRHSSFTYRNGEELWAQPLLRCVDEEPAMMALDSTIGYVGVGTFKSQNEAAATAYTAGIQTHIQKADNSHLKGWIIDLRGNHGGLYQPMLKGLASFFRPETLMYFQATDSTFEPVALAPYLLDSSYHLLKSNPKVAVLIGNATASAGEAIAITFKGRVNSRCFGKQTCGVSTGRKDFQISDIGDLNLAVTTMADKHRNLYGGSVMPDDVEPTSLAALEKAVAWLNQ